MLTVTLKALARFRAVPSSSVRSTVMACVLGPSAYVWLWAGIVPGELIVKTVAKAPSPQSTETDHGASAPESVNEPMAKSGFHACSAGAGCPVKLRFFSVAVPTVPTASYCHSVAVGRPAH